MRLNWPPGKRPGETLSQPTKEGQAKEMTGVLSSVEASLNCIDVDGAWKMWFHGASRVFVNRIVVLLIRPPAFYTILTKGVTVGCPSSHGMA